MQQYSCMAPILLCGQRAAQGRESLTVKHYAEIAAPLTDLLGSKVQWVWGAAEQAAFDTLKQALCNAPVLLIPDLRGDFIIDTDASQRSIGGII